MNWDDKQRDLVRNLVRAVDRKVDLVLSRASDPVYVYLDAGRDLDMFPAVMFELMHIDVYRTMDRAAGRLAEEHQ